jgi:hypothetical protein
MTSHGNRCIMLLALGNAHVAAAFMSVHRFTHRRVLVASFGMRHDSANTDTRPSNPRRDFFNLVSL